MAETTLRGETGRLSRPLRYAVRIAVFLSLLGFLAYILQQPLRSAFMANPGLNGLILGALAVGLIVGIREFMRLDGEVRPATSFRAGRRRRWSASCPCWRPSCPPCRRWRAGRSAPASSPPSSRPWRCGSTKGGT